MAATPNPNQPGADTTPGAAAPRGVSNPLSGTEYAQLGEDINRLKEKMDAGAMSAKELAQEQANLIDNHQALVAMRIKEMAAADRLSRKIQELTANTTVEGQQTDEYKSRLDELQKSLKISQDRATDFHKAATMVGSALNKVVKSTEAKAKHEEDVVAKQNRLQELLKSKTAETGAAVMKGAGRVGELGRMAVLFAARAPMVGAAIGAAVRLATGPIGVIITALQAVSAIAKVSTRETTTFASTYGAALGAATAQQNIFRNVISNWGRVLLDFAKVQQIGSAAMRAGTYDAYTAMRLASTQAISFESATMEVAQRLGEASEQMAYLGGALGMTEEESGKLLSTFTTTMGAFDAADSNANVKLTETINRFGQMNRATGMAVPNLLKLIGDISEESLWMGNSFNTTVAQTTLLTQAVETYGTSAVKNGNLALASSAGIEKATRMLLGLGSAMSATETYGYMLASGLAKTKDPIKGVLQAASMTPVERLNAMVTGWKKMGMGTDALVFKMITADKRLEQFVPTLRGLMGNTEAMGKFQAAARARDKDGIERALQGMPANLAEGSKEIVKMLNLSKDPLEKLVELTTNMVSYLSNITSLLQRFSPGYVPTAAPQARSALSKLIGLGKK